MASATAAASGAAGSAASGSDAARAEAARNSRSAERHSRPGAVRSSRTAWSTSGRANAASTWPPNDGTATSPRATANTSAARG